MKSKIYSSDHVKLSSKGQVWIPVLLTLGFLMAFPVAELLMLGNWYGMDYETYQIAMLYENLWRDGFVATGFVVTVIAAFLNGINGFWYLYSSRKIDFYHSFPVTRSQMFWNRTFVSVIYYLVPYVIMEFLAVCLGAFRGFFSMKLMKMAVCMLLIHLVMYLMLYFTVVLVISMTGNLLMGALCLAGINFYGPVLGILISYYQAALFSTYPDIDYGILKILKSQSTPLYLARSFLDVYAYGKFGSELLIMIIVTGILIICAYLAYTKRPAEAAGHSMVYCWSEAVISFLVTVAVGLGVGFIFLLATNGIRGDRTLQIKNGWWIFGLAFGTVLSHGILEIIYKMDFKKFFSHKIQLAAAGAVVAVCAVILRQDLMGYDTYLPDREKLESVSIDFDTSMYNSESMSLVRSENGVYDINEYIYRPEETLDMISITPNNGLYQAIQKIVSKEKTRSGRTSAVPVKYVLSSGRSVYRRYDVGKSELKELLRESFEDEKYKKMRYSFLEIDKEYLEESSISFMSGMTYVYQKQQEGGQELLEALQQDIEEASSEDFVGIPIAKVAFQYNDVPLKASVSNLVPGREPYTYFSTRVNIYPGFKRTVALLQKTGYPLCMEDVDIESVELVYYSTKDDGEINWEDSEQVTYTSQEEIEELKKCMVESSLIPFWAENEPSIEGIARLKGGQDSFISVDLLKDQLPDFVKKALK